MKYPSRLQFYLHSRLSCQSACSLWTVFFAALLFDPLPLPSSLPRDLLSLRFPTSRPRSIVHSKPGPKEAPYALTPPPFLRSPRAIRCGGAGLWFRTPGQERPRTGPSRAPGLRPATAVHRRPMQRQTQPYFASSQPCRSVAGGAAPGLGAEAMAS